jgi:two-component system, LytTR family, response regulator
MIKPLSYILADDDAMYREYTLEQLRLISGLECLHVCENAFDTRDRLLEQLPDLLILDIKMPGLTGIQLAKSLKQLPFIIFISSHASFAAEAFDLDAVDYLVKPVPPERLLRAVDKVKTLMEIKSNTNGEEGFSKQDEDSFFIKEKNAFVRIFNKEVLYAESLGDFVTLFLVNGDKKLVLVSMKSLEQQLSEKVFIRISRTHLVNKLMVTALDHDCLHLGKIQLPIGKTYTEAVMANIVGNQAIKRFL